MILGIDPGRHGALALFDPRDSSVTTTDMPDTTHGLHEFIAALPLIRTAILEKPFCGPTMGRTTIATMFQQYGILLGALQWRDIPTQEVAPAKWKAALGLSKSKAASRDMASQIFPAAAGQWALKKHDGRAEAALLAWWGRA